nr:beta 13 n galactosyltransferase [Hymenolepis microstoma]
MRFLKLPSKVCAVEGPNKSDRFSIVVVVKTAVHNFERRRIHRETHAHIKDYQLDGFQIAIVYSVGIPRKINSNKFNFSSGLTLELSGPNGKVLNEMSPNETLKKLEEEMKEYDDLIVGEYEDTYYNLTLKMMHSYYWFAYFCHPNKPILIYLDDDFAFNATYLGHFVKNLSPTKRENLVSGSPKWHGPVVRFDNAQFGWKWGQLKSEEPWRYHAPHLLGPTAIVGYSAARAMAITMSFTRFGRVDDAWLGLVLAKLQLQITPFKDIYVYRIPNNTKQVAFSGIGEFNKFVTKHKP